MKVFAGLMIAGALLGSGAPAIADSAPAPSATPLGDAITLEVSPEWWAATVSGHTENQYSDSYARVGFTHSLGQGFSWAVNVQDLVSAPGGHDGWGAETALGYRWNQGPLIFTVAGGTGYTTAAPGNGTYYVLYGSADWKMDPKWTLNAVGLRWRDSFGGGWVTPKIQTGVTYAIDRRQSVYLSLGYAWRNSVADKENFAVGYRLGF